MLRILERRVLEFFYINTIEIPEKLYYAAEGAIYYVTIATVIFSRVKITCYFHV